MKLSSKTYTLLISRVCIIYFYVDTFLYLKYESSYKTSSHEILKRYKSSTQLQNQL